MSGLNAVSADFAATLIVRCQKAFGLAGIVCVLGWDPRPADAAVPGWPDEVREVSIPSSFDGSRQPALWWTPVEKTPGRKPAVPSPAVPLVVALHTWSSDYRQTNSVEYWQECRGRGWAMIHPDFRGRNIRPEACASDAAVGDVVDAVRFACVQAPIDTNRIYLVGNSGGGHMALVMAHRHPAVWAGVSAWVPISDLGLWHRESVARKQRYAAEMEAVCGGLPGTSAAVDAEYRKRSPLHFLAAARGVPIDLNAGIHDGHTGSVPVGHTLRAFNALAFANGLADCAVSEEDIGALEMTEQVPPPLRGSAADPAYAKPVLFRRSAGPVRVTLFEGGHEILTGAAFAWLARQVRPTEGAVNSHDATQR